MGVRFGGRRGHPGALGVATVLALLSWLVAGCGPSSGGTAATPESSTTTASAPSSAATQPVGLTKSEPVSVEIPKIAAKSSLIPLGLNSDRTVEVPPVTQPMQAGWYKSSPTPGEIGPAIILGHVDGDKKPGIFYRLRELKAGDEIKVARQDGRTLTFVVQRQEQVPKAEFPADEVYGNTEGPELRLITCGGVFDHSAKSYRDNIIVYATLVT